MIEPDLAKELAAINRRLDGMTGLLKDIQEQLGRDEEHKRRAKAKYSARGKKGSYSRQNKPQGSGKKKKAAYRPKF